MLDKLRQKMEQARDAAENAAATILRDKVEEGIQQYRYNICRECDKLYKPTDTCKVCGCFMKIKTWIPKQSCPLKKWDVVNTNQ